VDILQELALVLVENAIKEGVKSVLGIWHEEAKLIKTWVWSKTTCVTKSQDKYASAPYKRMVAMMYLIGL
jgi:hypothetical protein